MDYYKGMLGLAESIRNKDLRLKVIDIIKNPKLSNPKFAYKGISMKDAPASLGWHHVEEGGLAKHTYVVTKLCVDIGELMMANYEIELNMDTLIAGALLHDIAKLFDMEKNGKGFDQTSLSIDHIIMGSAELYARGFPEPVVHMIASHFGDQGTTTPQVPEAVILHHVDTLDAIIGTSKTHKLLQLLTQ
ncbi:MAG: HDIG domain-containing protein [Candidatus Aenigmarchaeota archaeon]|nr:HDIG domain-containing protein [Candidatus Aenigmarchaeota archaeon]